MFIIGNLIIAIAKVVDVVLMLTTFLILASVVISWLNADPFNPIVRFVRRLTDPLFDFVKRRYNLVYNGIDFTPLALLLIIILLQNAVVPSLFEIGAHLNG